MARVLLINVEDLKTYTALGGNVDSDYVTQFVEIAQDKHILPVLGTTLMDKLKADITAGSLTGAYESLWELIRPCLCHFTMVEHIPFNTYKLKNAGTGQNTPDNTNPVTLSEMQNLVDIERDSARSYLDRVSEYLCANTESLPEYSGNSSGDVYPIEQTPFHGMTF